MAERLVIMIRPDNGKYYYTERVDLEYVDFIGICNNRLILEVCIFAGHRSGGSTLKEKMIVHDGKYHFREHSHLKKVKHSKFLDDKSYDTCIQDIIKETNSWCEDLGLPEITGEC